MSTRGECGLGRGGSGAAQGDAPSGELGAFGIAAANIAVFIGLGLLFLIIAAFMDHLATGAALFALLREEGLRIMGFALPSALPMLVVFLVVLFATEYFAYHYQYGVDQEGVARMSLLERLRAYPLSFFGRRDLAVITDFVVEDPKTAKDAYSRALPELYAAAILLAVAAVALLMFDWRLAIAALWSVPVALFMVFVSRMFMKPLSRSERAKKGSADPTEEIRAKLAFAADDSGVDERCLDGIRADMEKDEVDERRTIKGALATGICVNGAQVVLGLGVATTVLAGAAFIVAGTCDFMTLFCFLLVVSRIYVPFDQCLRLIAELFAVQTAGTSLKGLCDEFLANMSDLGSQGQVFDRASSQDALPYVTSQRALLLADPASSSDTALVVSSARNDASELSASFQKSSCPFGNETPWASPSAEAFPIMDSCDVSHGYAGA